MIKQTVDDIVANYAHQGLPSEEWELAGIMMEMAQYIHVLSAIQATELEGKEYQVLVDYLQEQAFHAYDAKESSMGDQIMRDVERMIILRIIDQKWIDHLHEMDALRDGIGLRAYGQKDPLI